MLHEYCSQRLTPDRIGPITLVITGASQLIAPSGHSIAMDALLAVVVIAQFRIWDDVADRGRDAITHPERITVLEATAGPLVLACALLGLGGFAIVILRAPSTAPAIALAGLSLVMALWYWGRGGRSLLGDHLLLAKYPTFVLVVVMSRGATLTTSAALVTSAVFLAACVYEGVHDRTSPVAKRPALLACEAALLGMALVCSVRL